MFVLAAPGAGYGRAVLAELERTAAAAGRRRVVLETGTRQPEAIALYTSGGYSPWPDSGSTGIRRTAGISRKWCRGNG